MKSIEGYTEDELNRGLKFYEESPDGQYDEIAAAAIRHELVKRVPSHYKTSDDPRSHEFLDTKFLREFGASA